MTPTDTLIFVKNKTGDEWTHSGSFNMKGFELDDYGHTSIQIVNNFHDKVKDKYSATKCGKITFKFTQCVPEVNITGDCHPSERDAEKRKTLKESIIKDIIKDSKGKLTNSSSDKIDDSFFNDYLKNGISIHVKYEIRDCEPPKVAPALPPGPKPKPEECTYEALIKFKLKGHCMLEKEKENLGPLYENLKKRLKTIKNAEYGEHIYEVSIYDPGTSDEHLLRESHIEPDATSKKSVAEAEKVIRARGSSFGKRKSIIKKKNPKKKVIKKRFSKC